MLIILNICIPCYPIKRRTKIRTMNRLKKYLEEIGISLNRYKDFWNDCKKNAQKMTRFIKRLLNKLDSCNITCEPAAIKKELEVYQESLILDKELVISYNGELYFNVQLYYYVYIYIYI